MAFQKLKMNNGRNALTKDLNKFLSVEFSKSAEQNFPEELKENYDHYPIIFIDGNLQLDNVQENGLKIVKNEKFLKSVKKEGTNPVLNFTNASQTRDTNRS